MSARDPRSFVAELVVRLGYSHDTAEALVQQALDAERAEVLREAADQLDLAAECMTASAWSPTEHAAAREWRAAADELRRMADETAGGKDTQPGESTSPAESTPLTVYRASHDSIGVGLYTTAAAARAHCEAYVRREIGDEGALDWIEDDEDGVAELVAEIGGAEDTTGYVVMSLTVASVYDEEADE
ncbi:hypothetical protein [Streptomyces sp. NPDC001985]|uniref:hypothetical protein n=1 Tax=Streptomyces sp. NPDC001985 TaxID=3154406 RepID=UPI003325A98C